MKKPEELQDPHQSEPCPGGGSSTAGAPGWHPSVWGPLEPWLHVLFPSRTACAARVVRAGAPLPKAQLGWGPGLRGGLASGPSTPRAHSGRSGEGAPVPRGRECSSRWGGDWAVLGRLLGWAARLGAQELVHLPGLHLNCGIGGCWREGGPGMRQKDQQGRESCLDEAGIEGRGSRTHRAVWGARALR